jgi:hypothetical protein
VFYKLESKYKKSSKFGLKWFKIKKKCLISNGMRPLFYLVHGFFFLLTDILRPLFNSQTVSGFTFNAVAMLLVERSLLRLIRSRIVLMTAEVETGRFRVGYWCFSMQPVTFHYLIKKFWVTLKRCNPRKMQHGPIFKNFFNYQLFNGRLVWFKKNEIVDFLGAT